MEYTLTTAAAAAVYQAVRDVLQQAGYQPEPMRRDVINGKAMFFVKDPDGLPIEIHE